MKKIGAIIFLLIFLTSLASAYYKYDNEYDYKIIHRYHSDGYHEKIILNYYEDKEIYYDYSSYEKQKYSYYKDYKDYDYYDSDYYKRYKPYYGVSGTYIKFNQVKRAYEPSKCYHSPPKDKWIYRKCP